MCRLFACTGGPGFGRSAAGRVITRSRPVPHRRPLCFAAIFPDMMAARRNRVTVPKPTNLEAQCLAKGMRMTEQRRVIARVLSASADHPDVEELYRRCAKIDDRISISTVYRTVKLFEDSGIIERHDFREGRARYEQIPESHHDHLINLRTGQVIEFRSEEIEKLQAEVARRLGYQLVDHRLELYAVPLDDKARR